MSNKSIDHGSALRQVVADQESELPGGAVGSSSLRRFSDITTAINPPSLLAPSPSPTLVNEPLFSRNISPTPEGQSTRADEFLLTQNEYSGLEKDDVSAEVRLPSFLHRCLLVDLALESEKPPIVERQCTPSITCLARFEASRWRSYPCTRDISAPYATAISCAFAFTFAFTCSFVTGI
ncbi:hypothetical protein C8F04DRAFT_579095 [Mycena alexandri]|uniref:Uncharacterized protein n=1 Tax=Mycena alexandri TaxID=1745969 RepID=A0AAD6X6V7_9AGAR|nr:hypothetical protein C8F04DRAFT_579095 [Mycena alexandri]